MSWLWIAVWARVLSLPQAEATPPLDPPSVALPAELQRVLSDYERAWRETDGTALAGLFDENGFVMSPGSPPVRGRSAIREGHRRGGGPLALRAFAYATEGTVGYILGGFGAERGQPDRGKFTLTLRKGSDGRWLIVSDMDNGNAPPPPPAPASRTPSG